MNHIIGLISDTHGLMRAEALRALAGVDQIIHAGDVGGPEVLEALAGIAPVTAVRGNNDTSPWGRTLPHTAEVVLEQAKLFVIHDLHDLAIRPAEAGYGAVVSGHTHRALAQERDGVLFVNPGAAGPRRFRLPVTLALLHIDGEALRVEHIKLLV